MINYNLKAERVRRNKKQSDMSELLEITVAAYSQKESGKRCFTIKEVEKIAELFELNAEQIKEIFFTKKLNANDKLNKVG